MVTVSTIGFARARALEWLVRALGLHPPCPRRQWRWAVSWLNFWKDNFTNIGRGTLHDSDFYGATTLFMLVAAMAW